MSSVVPDVLGVVPALPAAGGATSVVVYTDDDITSKVTPATFASPGVDSYLAAVVLSRGSGGLDFSGVNGPLSIQLSGTDLVAPITDNLFSATTSPPATYRGIGTLLIPASSTITVTWPGATGTTTLRVSLVFTTIQPVPP